MDPEIYYGTTWMVDSRKYPNSATDLAEITGVPDQLNRTELPLTLSHNGKMLAFLLLGKDRTESFLDDFGLRTSEYRDLVGRVVKIWARVETFDDHPVIVGPLYGIKPEPQARLAGLKVTTQFNNGAAHP